MIPVEVVAPAPARRVVASPHPRRDSHGATSGEMVAAHALVWLVVGCGVGLWMATLLVLPELGRAIAPWTYGRWAPLHLDLTLYGWLAMPLVGMLLRWYGADRLVRGVSWALAGWSAALAAGAASWLGGRTSGKLFLDWSGPAGWIFAIAQGGVALLLGVALVARLRTRGWDAGTIARTALWVALVSVPVALGIASGGRVYPPIDPASGGPTGTSLLGSSLGLIAILVATPRLLGLTVVSSRRSWLGPAALAAHTLLFLLLDHGDHGHREPLQQLALASVAIWAWLLPRELGRYLWPIGSRRWIGSLAAWGVLLLATGLAAFQPGVLERVKFGQGLVAHAHVAMAGFGSSFVVLLSHALLAGGRRARLWSGRAPFALWHAGLTLQVVSLALLGAWESADPAALLRGGTAVEAMLGVRWLGGAAMLGAAAIWGGGVLRGSR